MCCRPFAKRQPSHCLAARVASCTGSRTCWRGSAPARRSSIPPSASIRSSNFEKSTIDDVVDLQAGVLADRPDRERRAARLVGRVDLGAAEPVHRHVEVARDREVRDPVVRRIGAHEHDRVGVPEPRAALAAAPSRCRAAGSSSGARAAARPAWRARRASPAATRLLAVVHAARGRRGSPSRAQTTKSASSTRTPSTITRLHGGRRSRGSLRRRFQPRPAAVRRAASARGGFAVAALARRGFVGAGRDGTFPLTRPPR